jgi:AcrR family transcriptional regulator
MSMQSIAARAGVSKVSLYRRWSSKHAIFADVLRFLGGITAITDHGSFEADIRALLDQNLGSRSATSAGKLVMRMMGEISGNAELLGLYRTHLLAPRIEQIRGLVERARDRNELRAGLPVDVACAMIAGPLFLYYVTLVAETEVDLSRNPAEQLTRAILNGVASLSK